MNTDLQTVMDHFDSNDITYRILDDNPVLKLGFEMDNGNFDCLFIVSSKPRSLEFLSIFPVKVPESKRLQVAELLLRANAITRIGQLRMDMDKGRVSSKTSIMLGPDSTLDDEMIQHLVAANLVLADENLPNIQKIIFGDLSAKEVMQIAELEDEPASLSKPNPTFGGRLGQFFNGSNN